MITVAETQSFRKKAQGHLSEEDREDLIAYLSAFPQSGAIIRGTNGIRKIRWARSGGGKSGGYRVIYYFYNETMPLYILALFSKTEKISLSGREKNNLAKLTKELVAFWRQNNE